MGFRFRRITSRLRASTRAFRNESIVLPLAILALVFFSFVFGGHGLLAFSNDLDHSLAKTLLRHGLPTTALKEEKDPISLNLRSFIYYLTNYDLQDPLNLMVATLPLGPSLNAQLRVFEERPFVFIQEFSFAPEPVPPALQQDVVPESARPIPKAARILVYHTHSSEMYLGRALTASQSSQGHYQFRNLADPTVTGVMAAGRHLSNALNKLGLETMHEVRIHTLPTIAHSYSNSEKTVREILAKDKNFDMVIDLHRDAGVANPTININGRKVARIAIVVGTAERISLSHPNYKENLKFAEKIKKVCDQMYPGLMRPVQVQMDARYNQHLHPRSLIIELGSVENTLEEALLAVELLANVLVRAL